MPYYNKCNACGANLDPGEKCDCADTIGTIRISHDRAATKAEHERIKKIRIRRSLGEERRRAS